MESDPIDASERFGATGYAHFDLLDGNGFFIKPKTEISQTIFYLTAKEIKNLISLYMIGNSHWTKKNKLTRTKANDFIL